MSVKIEMNIIKHCILNNLFMFAKIKTNIQTKFNLILGTLALDTPLT